MSDWISLTQSFFGTIYNDQVNDKQQETKDFYSFSWVLAHGLWRCQGIKANFPNKLHRAIRNEHDKRSKWPDDNGGRPVGFY